MNEIEKVRIATAIDCEGTINIYWNKYYAQPRVEIANNDLIWLKYFKNEIGFGNIGPSGITSFSLRFCHRQAEHLLKIILKYLMIKRKKGKTILTYYYLKDTLGRNVAREFALMVNPNLKPKSI